VTVELEFAGEVWYWRGPAPFCFVSVPEPLSAHLHDVSPTVTYG
jgi:hypothetical protein